MEKRATHRSIGTLGRLACTAANAKGGFQPRSVERLRKLIGKQKEDDAKLASPRLARKSASEDEAVESHVSAFNGTLDAQASELARQARRRYASPAGHRAGSGSFLNRCMGRIKIVEAAV